MPVKKAVSRRLANADAIAHVPRAAYTVNEFCAAHRISVALYYKLKLQGLAPRETRVLSRVIISMEAAAEWRRARENDDDEE